MGLKVSHVLLQRALRGGYAVGAFNANNLETMQAIFMAAQAENAPVILGFAARHVEHLGASTIVAIARDLAERTGVEASVHLDHGPDYKSVLQCIHAGFNSVMIDGSAHPLEENISLTGEVVKAAHAAGVSVEGELGRIAGAEAGVRVEEGQAGLTDPDEAATFVHETGVDSLAVAIGTAHGVYRELPKLDFGRLKEIAAKTGIPIVLHGGSGVPDGDVRKTIGLGVAKINVYTECMMSFLEAVRDKLSTYRGYDLHLVTGEGRRAMKDKVVEKIRLFGGAGRAW